MFSGDIGKAPRVVRIKNHAHRFPVTANCHIGYGGNDHERLFATKTDRGVGTGATGVRGEYPKNWRRAVGRFHIGHRVELEQTCGPTKHRKRRSLHSSQWL